LKLSDLSGPYPFLVVMPQAALEGLLEKELTQRKIGVAWNHRVAQLDSLEDQAVATIERLGKVSTGYAVATTEWEVERVFDARADFVVGADGHRSLIRRRLDIGYEQLSEPEYFAVFEFDGQGSAPDEVRIVLDETTTNVLWPLPGSQCRWSFQLPADQAEQAGRFKDRVGVQIGRSHFPQLTDEHLHELIRQRAPWFDMRVGNVKWAMLIRFERRLANGFGRDRVWLAGDAAHLANPVGMRSMNVGLREAHELAGCAAQILKQGASAEVLQLYNADREKEWRQLFGLDGQATVAAQADDWVRTHADRILQCIPASGDTLRELAEQIGLSLPADVPMKS
jgi:2-polyprenyl-6-methoxyphenol hydroxylase-like FAD-dependent oxidoreductase